MAPSTATSSLDALQNSDQRKILDIVDQLRRTGLSSILKLPQIVVCGDQSAGKSSVLEAITEIPFPRKENLCTRFATEIILKRDNVSSITTTITPDKNKSQAEQDKLRGFCKSIKNLHDFAKLVEEATSLMGLDDVENSATKAFTRDVFRVEICGPDRPQLTLVDLPGIIQASSKEATDADVELIQNLVKNYIANERTIILAVVSAKNDFNNQIILKYCRDVDQNGSRTLGIITKPDWLKEGSPNEKAWISLAQNKSVYFNLGWHMLRNRSEDMMNSTFQERNAAEDLFFSTGGYQGLPRDMLGIKTLSTKLSKLLYNHLKKELPGLKKELLDELATTQSELSQLGVKRASVTEQRQFLTALSMDFHDIVGSALKGHYERSFFGPIDTTAEVDAESNLPRFRAVVQDLNIKFAKSMRLKGHKYAMSALWEYSENSEDESESSSVDDDAGENRPLNSSNSFTAVNKDVVVSLPPNQPIFSSAVNKDVGGSRPPSQSIFSPIGNKDVGGSRPPNQPNAPVNTKKAFGGPTPPNTSNFSFTAEKGTGGSFQSNQWNSGSKRKRARGTHRRCRRPADMTRIEAEDWVLRILKRSRGRELPGNFNPLLISHIFWEQSEPWKQLAREHIEAVAEKCSQFVSLVLKGVATNDVTTRVWELKVEPALNIALAASRAELDRIIEDKNCHPITYNHYYTTTIQRKRQKKLQKAVGKCTKDATVSVFAPSAEYNGQPFGNKEFIDPHKLHGTIDRHIVQDMDRFSAQEALDSQQAYYKVSLPRYYKF